MNPEDSIEISTANRDELQIVAALRAAMADEAGKNWDSRHPGWRDKFVDYFAGRQESELSQIYVARHNKQLIGIAASSMVEDYHSAALGRIAGRINGVYVKPEFRRQGLGRRLMQASMAWLQSKGCVTVRLNSSEEGKKLYESLGFKHRNEMEYYF